MSARVEATLSPEQLLEAVARMSSEELASFTRRVIELRARRVAPVLPTDESLLIEQINRALPHARQSRYEALLAARDAETLTQAEHAELIGRGRDRSRP